MNMIEIERALRELRLSGIAETLSTRVMQAQAAQEPFLETFGAMLQDELDRRRSRLTARVRHQNADFAFLVKPLPCESTTYAHFCGSFVVATS